MPSSLKKSVVQKLRFIYWLIAMASLSVSAFANSNDTPTSTTSIHADATIFIPAQLQGWRSWVLDKHRDINCPRNITQLDQRLCAWPGRLSIDASANAAQFSQTGQLFAPGWVILPGEERYWPRDTRLHDGNNEYAAQVVAHDGRPALWLNAGEYSLHGSITWEELPSRLALPSSSALVSLTVEGKPLATTLDEQGFLLLGKTTTAPTDADADSLKVQVFRKLDDGIPIEMNTELRLAVAGHDREITLGQFLLDGSQVINFDSPLPARIEADGQLRMQVRAGQWTVHLRSRFEGQPLRFASKKTSEDWPAEEVWVFAEDSSLRRVSVSGAPAIDPSQTELPETWRTLPAFLMRTTNDLQLTVQQRGDTASTPDQLRLVRDMWLAFDGNGYTIRDRINGNLNRAARFVMAEGYTLGSANVNGEPQLITTLSNAPKTAEKAGIELRQGALNLTALSRFEPIKKTLSASGWQTDFSQVSALLHVPPGWLLLHANGADSENSTWLARWNLWAIFVVLIIAATSLRLLGMTAGITALAALLLSYHAGGAPIFIWLNALLALALLRALPQGRVQRALTLYLSLSFVLLVMFIVQFSITQVRLAMYPQLEKPWQIQTATEAQAEDATPTAARANEAMMAGAVRAQRKMFSLASTPPPPMPALKTGYDSTAKIQTGPGLPAWEWQTVDLRWNGSVIASQNLHLYWLSPAAYSTLRLLSVLLIFFFAGILLRAACPLLCPAREPTSLANAAASPLLLIIMLALLSGGWSKPALAADGFPPPAFLTELESRLLLAPDCAPDCAAINTSLLQINENSLRIELAINNYSNVAVPLPVKLAQWQPRAVIVDGKNAISLLRGSEGALWLALPVGAHSVVLEGEAPTDTMQLPFTLATHNIRVVARGWEVSGLVDGFAPSGNLELRREQKTATAGQAAQLQPVQAPVFVTVTRTINLGLEWTLDTVVERISPQQGAISLVVNTLPDEAVLTGGIRMQDGKVQVAMGASDQTFSWHSSLKQNAHINLKAATEQPWVEIWRFDVSPIWHVDFSGLPPIKQQADSAMLPTWQPWPGESLTLAVQRPVAVDGATHTIESVHLNYTPGARAGHMTLDIVMRSSQGGEWALTLPPNSQLLAVTLDGIAQSNPLSGEKLRLNLHPGTQKIHVEWRQLNGIGWHDSTPALALGEAASNIQIDVSPSANRWLLLAGGPAMGPALLFWGVLLIVLAASFALGYTRMTPVKTWQWLLLGLGMSTINSAGSLLLVIWFFAMAYRAKLDINTFTRGKFNTLQVALVLLTLLALGSLLGTIPMSLLSSPDMQVAGNGSTARLLQWYQDQSVDTLPQAWTISTPMWVYRVVMLAWSLWIVFACINWSRWAWHCFSAQALWRPKSAEELKAKDAVKNDFAN